MTIDNQTVSVIVFPKSGKADITFNLQDGIILSNRINENEGDISVKLLTKGERHEN